MAETAFSVASMAAMVAWLVLGIAAALPDRPIRPRLLFLAGRVVPLGLCLAYAAALFRYWGSAPPGSGFGSLAAVMSLFTAPGKVLGGWLHFLAFDLIVGRALVDHALAGGRSRLVLLVVLPATFLYGPIGVLLYAVAQVRRAPR